MNSILGFTAFIVSLLLYLVIARKAGKLKVTHPDQFFLSKSAHDDSQFASSQISYALQMATVYPFFIFAFTGLWWLAVWNTLFYAIGIALLYAVIPLFMGNHLELVGSPKTLHAFIAGLHGTPALRRFTAWMSIIGFTGLAAFEIVWGARILRVLFNGNSSIYYLAIVLLAFYLVLYLWLGGQRGTINTGQFQLVIAYIGIHAAVAWAVLQPVVSVGQLNAGVVVAIVVTNCILMLVFRFRSMRKEIQMTRLAKALGIVVITSLMLMMVAIFSMHDLFSLETFSLKLALIDSSTKEFGWQLAAFALLPLFFQFVDMTNWQRMASLARTDNAGLLQRVRRGLAQYLIESPLSWFLPVLLGICGVLILGKDPQGDPWDGFIGHIISTPGIIGALLSVAVVCGVAAVFLSTADGLLSAVGYSFAYDIHKRSRNMVDKHTKPEWPEADVKYVVGKGRGAMFLLLMVVIGIFVVADIASNKGETILGVFLSFFSPMVSFAPSILIPAVTRRTAHGAVAFVSITCGAIIGITCGVISVFKGGVWQWYPAVAAFGLSWFIYLVGMFLGIRKIAEGRVE